MSAAKLSLRKLMEVLEQVEDDLDLNDWERKFVPDMVAKWKQHDRDTTWMTSRQAECVEKIAKRYL